MRSSAARGERSNLVEGLSSQRCVADLLSSASPLSSVEPRPSGQRPLSSAPAPVLTHFGELPLFFWTERKMRFPLAIAGLALLAGAFSTVGAMDPEAYVKHALDSNKVQVSTGIREMHLCMHEGVGGGLGQVASVHPGVGSPGHSMRR